MMKKLRQKIKDGMLRDMYRELKWLLKYTKKYSLSIAVFILLGIVSSAAGLGSSVASKYLIDAVTGFDAVGIVPAAAMAGLMVGNIVIQSLYNRFSTVLDVKIKAELQGLIYDKIMVVRWEAVQDFRSGDMMNRINTDAKTVSSGATGFIPNLITNGVKFVGAFIIIMVYDPIMAVIALISVPLSGIVSRLLIRQIRRHNEVIKKLDSEIMAFNEDSLSNIQTLKAFGLGGTFSSKFALLMERFKTENLEYNRFTVLSYAALSAIGLLVYGCCFGWGVFRLWSGTITYGTMTLFLSMSSYLQGSFSGLISLVPGIISAATSTGRIMDIMELPDEEPDWAEYATGKMAVNLENVTFAYKNGRRVLTDFDFSAAPGETVAVAGPSGEGKTTLIRVILGLVAPSDGRAELVCGERRMEISADTRKYMAYVPQGNTLFAGTIADNLRLVKETPPVRKCRRLWRLPARGIL